MEVETVEEAENEIMILGHHLINFFACFLGKNPKKRIDKLMDITKKVNQEMRGEKFYGEEFIENADSVLKKISRNSKVKIKLVTTEDDFCKKCPQLDKCRWDRIGAEKEDEEIIKVFGCEVNRVYSFDELLKMGKEFIRAQENQTYIFRSWIGKKLLYQIKSLGD